ncbi:MAG: MBL fold metallo-hydrolase [Hyphomicrobiaceae bacterium]
MQPLDRPGLGSLLTRRALMKGALGASAVLAADATTCLVAQTKSHTTKIGSMELTVLSDGIFSLPTSIMLPGQSQASLEPLLTPPSTVAALVVQTNVVLIRSGKTLALIDTGAGADFMPTLGRLADALDAMSIAADAITHVIFTHAHADHLWGVMDPFGDGSRWPKARHVMMGIERDHWLKAGIETQVPDHMKGMAIGIQRRLKSLGDTISTVKDGEEIASGMAFMATPGHTPGHASIKVRSGSEEMIIGGDALTHATISFANPGWQWGSDSDWQLATKTRAKLLDQLASSKARLLGYHLPWPGIGHVEAHQGAYRFVAA